MTNVSALEVNDKRIEQNSSQTPIAIAVADLKTFFSSHRLWMWMAYIEIKRRYRRTLIGPFWTTLSYGILVGAIGTLWARIFNTNVQEFLPYFACGMMVWMFIATTINESCAIFVANGHLLTHTRLPYSIHIYATVLRNIIVMCHHLVVAGAVVIILGTPLSIVSALAFVIGMAFLAILLTPIALMVAVICLRFRDLPQVISSVLQICMFITPIMWPEKQFASGTQTRLYLVDLNPLYYMVSIVRDPLLGTIPPTTTYLVMIGGALIVWIPTFFIFARYRKYLVFWV